MRALGMISVVLVACAPVAADRPDAALTDAPVDAALRPPRPLDASISTYVECTTDGDCADGLFCNLAHPRGQCTRACSADDDCPAGGSCSSGTCFVPCVEGTHVCRDDQMCAQVSEGHACVASCSSTDPTRTCTPPYVCIGSFCRAASTVVGPAPIGAPCAALDGRECATRQCQVSQNGWPGGMCLAFTRMPSTESFVVPGPMPANGCPDGSVALGIDFAIEGDRAQCVPRCVTDGDCRDGYRCERRGVFEAPLHDDGGCVPWHCGASIDLPCAAGRECRIVDPAFWRSACFAPVP